MNALDVRCPSCGSMPGRACRSVGLYRVLSKPHRARARLAEAGGNPRRGRDDIPSSVRKQVRERSGGACEARVEGVCTGRAVEMHHVLPRSQGGPHTKENLLDTCGECHDWIDAHRREATGLGLLRSGARHVRRVGEPAMPASWGSE